MKICKNCKYYKKVLGEVPLCLYSVRNNPVYTNIVSGKTLKYAPSACFAMREYENLCGRNGNHYEEKDTIKKKIIRIFNKVVGRKNEL